MSFVGAAVSIGTSLVGGLIGGDASEDAANTQAAAADRTSENALLATRETNALNEKIYREQIERQKPWLEAGQNALAGLSAGTAPGGEYMRDFGMADFNADPGYQFRLSEGEKGINRSMAARGGFNSGAALKGLARYGQDLASQEYGNAYNRFQTNQSGRFNRLATLAGVGQTASGALGQAGQNYAGAAGNALMEGTRMSNDSMLAGANARASGYVGQANALNGALGQGMNWWNQRNANGSGGGGQMNYMQPISYSPSSFTPSYDGGFVNEGFYD